MCTSYRSFSLVVEICGYCQYDIVYQNHNCFIINYEYSAGEREDSSTASTTIVELVSRYTKAQHFRSSFNEFLVRFVVCT